MNQTILGITNTKDSGAALIRNGQIVAVANEERFNRQKLTQVFPDRAIEYVLSQAKITFADVDHLTTGAWRGFEATEVLKSYIDDVAWNVARDPLSRQLIDQRVSVTLERDSVYRSELLAGVHRLGLEDRLTFVDHHRSHASAAFYCSPFQQSLVVVMDARGDFKSCSTHVGRGNNLVHVDSITDLNSPGVVYSFVTRLLGFTPDRHEGKITGLAAYGDPAKTRHIFDQMVFVDDQGRIRANIGESYSPFMTAKMPLIEGLLSSHTREDIAAGVQQWLEDLVVAYIKHQLQNHPHSEICLAGGIFANVKVNQRVMEIEGVDNIYVHQHMGDGGIALGSALEFLVSNAPSSERPSLPHVYLGPESMDDEIDAALATCDDLRSIPVDDVALVTARLLANGHVVGWFQGRMEYGPRALCNRSILVQATNADINDALNERLSRTEFMPFAPVTLDELAGECYVNWKPDHIASRFMTVCYDCTPGYREKVPAVVHVDNTARPQVISCAENALMHAVLTEYHRITGLPSIVNTSFNNHEEPIVCAPENALDSLRRNNVDVLVIGNRCVIQNNDPHSVLHALNCIL